MAYQLGVDGQDLDKGFHIDTVWGDIILPPDRLGSGASAPGREILIGNIQAFAFNGTSTLEQLFGSFEIPHDFKEGTDLRPHIHWAPSDSVDNNVKWFLEYSIANGNGDYTIVDTISVVVPTGGNDRRHYINELPVITGLNFLIGATCYFRFYRNPSDIEDTYANDAFLLSLGIHYEVDGDGSRNIMSK